MPLISFVVPVYNAATTLNMCVNSLLTQTFDDLEVILVDDGSKDNSLEIANAIAEVDCRVRVFHQENAGVSVARNKGIAEANGNYISFVDADDWIDDNVCEVFVENLKKHDYDLFCFAADYHFGNKHTYTKIFEKSIPLLSDAQREELHLKVMTPWAPGFEYNTNTRFAASSSGKFYRTKLLKNFGFEPGIIVSEDGLFNVIVLEKMNVIGFSSRCFYHYEQHMDSAQNRYRPNSIDCFDRVRIKIEKWLNENGKEKLFWYSANTLFVHFVFGTLKEDVFHRDNPKTFTQRICMLKKILSTPSYSKVLKSVKWNYFTFAEKILVLMLKLKMTRTIALAMKFVA